MIVNLFSTCLVLLQKLWADRTIISWVGGLVKSTAVIPSIGNDRQGKRFGGTVLPSARVAPVVVPNEVSGLLASPVGVAWDRGRAVVCGRGTEDRLKVQLRCCTLEQARSAHTADLHFIATAVSLAIGHRCR